MEPGDVFGCGRGSWNFHLQTVAQVSAELRYAFLIVVAESVVSLN